MGSVKEGVIWILPGEASRTVVEAYPSGVVTGALEPTNCATPWSSAAETRAKVTFAPETVYPRGSRKNAVGVTVPLTATVLKLPEKGIARASAGAGATEANEKLSV